jgi:hypothetical protein
MYMCLGGPRSCMEAVEKKTKISEIEPRPPSPSVHRVSIYIIASNVRMIDEWWIGIIWWTLYLWIYSLCGPWLLSQVHTLYTVRRTPWTGDQPVERPLSTHRITQAQNKRAQTSMHRVGFELTIPVFELAKMVHANVIGFIWWTGCRKIQTRI